MEAIRTFFFFLLACSEHDLGPVDVRLDGSHRAFDDQPHADRRRQVKDDVALVHQFGDRRRMMDALDRVMEPGMASQVADIVDASRREVVEHEHFVASLEIRIGQMRPDEPSPACDQHAHQTTPPEHRRTDQTLGSRSTRGRPP